jgi:uncharacterized repeat protein (TIGR04138 family)
MQAANFEKTVELIVARDPRYQPEAYAFMREALDYTQKSMAQRGQETVRHITGQELLAGIRAYALGVFGPMAMLVFQEWGVHRGEDFGEIVFNMVESGLLAKTDKDSREDFKGAYDFFEAFRKPFVPNTGPTGRAMTNDQ